MPTGEPRIWHSFSSPLGLVAEKASRARAHLAEAVGNRKETSCNCAVGPLRTTIYDALAKQWAQTASSLAAISIRDMINDLRPLCNGGSGCLKDCELDDYSTYDNDGAAEEMEESTLEYAAISLAELDRVTATKV
jgi:hypothetical protein